MKIFKLEIYRGNELIFSNVCNNNITLICNNIISLSKSSPYKLFVSVRQMYFNSFGELKPKMYKGKFNYALSCTVDDSISNRVLTKFFGRCEHNLIESKYFTNE